MKHSPILLCILAAAFFSACTPVRAADMPPETETAALQEPPAALPSETPAAELAPEPTRTPAIEPTPTPDYVRLSPTRIKAGDYTLDVLVDLYTHELGFTVYSEFPVSIEKAYPDGDVPSALKEFDIRIRDCASTLEAYGGGGGGGGEENGMTGRTYGTSFWVEPPLKEGERYHVTALVVFDESTGISQPVLFEYDLTAQKSLHPERFP